VVSISIPPVAIRDLRELVRGRHHLVRVRAKLMQTIKSLLVRQDVGDPPVTRLVSARGLAWLQAQRVPGASGVALQRLTRALIAVDAEAAAAEAEVKARAAADPIAGALQTLVGIGPVVALTLRGNRDDHALPTGARARQLCGTGQQHRFQRRPCTLRSDHAAGFAVAALGPGRGRAIHAMKRPDATGRWARRLAGRISICPARVALARVLCRDVVRVWRTVEGQ
jgi:transposase